jgi:hypothetical protein
MSTPRKRSLLAVALSLLLLAVAGALLYCRPDPRQVRVTELSDRLTAPQTTPPPPQEGRRLWRELHHEIGQLPAAAQRQFWDKRRRVFRDWVEDFFRAPRQEQAALLQQEIDRMREFQRQHASAGVPGAGWSAGLDAEELDRRRRQWLDLTTPEERALVGLYFEMLSQQGQQSGGGSGAPSPWGDAPC